MFYVIFQQEIDATLRFFVCVVAWSFAYTLHMPNSSRKSSYKMHTLTHQPQINPST